jgi:glycosyltransferase involved in cell wall biosynthesis
MSRTKQKVLFVGSFKESAKDGSVGGQMFASKTLINSNLKNDIDFLLIDSTADSVPAPPVYKRLSKVVSRFAKYTYYLIRYRPLYVLLFSSAGLSLLEKGSMAMTAKIFFTKVIFAPRSGLIKNNVESSAFYKSFLKIVLSVSDKIICQGSNWKNFYTSTGNYNADKFYVIPNWIDTSVYIKNRPRYQNQTSFARNLIYIGWIEEYKGILDLLIAISNIKKEIEGLTIYVYGFGSIVGKVKSMIKDLQIEDKVMLCGWANETAKLKALAEADIYVLPSHAEGFPNALIEALASGVPCISTDVGGVADIIINNETGILVPPNNPKQLGNAILALYKNEKLRQKLSVNGRQQAEKCNSLQAMYKNMQIILKP